MNILSGHCTHFECWQLLRFEVLALLNGRVLVMLITLVGKTKQ